MVRNVTLNPFQIIRSKDAWNSPEDCTDFPRCFIEISHVDIKKRSFTFALIASHEHDYAETEVIAYFEDPVKVGFTWGENYLQKWLLKYFSLLFLNTKEMINSH